jgi:hypothetical protein
MIMISVKMMSGPITLARASYILAGEDSWKLFLLLGLISINLAVVNFLPIPVLDGGCYRADVEGKLSRSIWSGQNAGDLSTSLSLALLRLKNEGAIDFANLADPSAGRAVLRGRGGRQLESVSHVLYKKGRP